jgi:hypothetical protein
VRIASDINDIETDSNSVSPYSAVNQYKSGSVDSFVDARVTESAHALSSRTYNYSTEEEYQILDTTKTRNAYRKTNTSFGNLALPGQMVHSPKELDLEPTHQIQKNEELNHFDKIKKASENDPYHDNYGIGKSNNIQVDKQEINVKQTDEELYKNTRQNVRQSSYEARQDRVIRNQFKGKQCTWSVYICSYLNEFITTIIYFIAGLIFYCTMLFNVVLYFH